MAKKSSGGKPENKTSNAKHPMHLDAAEQERMRRAKKLAQKHGKGRKHVELGGGNLLGLIEFNSRHNGNSSVLNRMQRTDKSETNANRMRKVAYSSRTVA